MLALSVESWFTKWQITFSPTFRFITRIGMPALAGGTAPDSSL